MLSLERDPAIGRFYVRRAFRIYPLAILCVGIVLAFKIPATPEAPFRAPSTLLLLSNLALLQNLIGHASISAPMWSLPFEVQMYAVLPFLRKLKTSFVIAMIFCFGVLGWEVQNFTGHSNILAYIPCFLCGVLPYSLRFKIRPFLPSSVWIVFLLAWISVFALTDLSLPVTWLATFILGLSIHCFRDSTSNAWNSVVRLISKYSYGIYLSHLPLMWVVFFVLPPLNLTVSLLCWLATTLATAIVVFHLLENPMIQMGSRLAYNRKLRRTEAAKMMPRLISGDSFR
jgi:peptidoglycan/LPS O-acetylase OafA/YrhL